MVLCCCFNAASPFPLDDDRWLNIELIEEGINSHSHLHGV